MFRMIEWIPRSSSSNIGRLDTSVVRSKSNRMLMGLDRMLLRWLCFDVQHASCPSSPSPLRSFGKIAQRRNLHAPGRQQTVNTLEASTHSTRHELTLTHQDKNGTNFVLTQTHEMALQHINCSQKSYHMYARNR